MRERSTSALGAEEREREARREARTRGASARAEVRVSARLGGARRVRKNARRGAITLGEDEARSALSLPGTRDFQVLKFPRPQ